MDLNSCSLMVTTAAKLTTVVPKVMYLVSLNYGRVIVLVTTLPKLYPFLDGVNFNTSVVS